MIKEIIGALFEECIWTNDNANKQVPLEFQLDILGLTDEKINELKGKKTLDIGCGDGSLVEYLRKRDVIAEGIDPRAPRGKKYFMRKYINGAYPMPHSVPREDNSYDLITSFQNTTLNPAFSGTQEGWEYLYTQNGYSRDKIIKTIQKLSISGFFVLSEASRLLKNKGSAIIYPTIPRAEKSMKSTFDEDDIIMSEENAPKDIVNKYLEWEGCDKEDCMDPLARPRTHLTKK